MSETAVFVAVAVLLVLLNGFFVAAEFAIVKLRLTQADDLAATHGVFGRVLRSVRSHLDAYLSACQLGITLASLALGWIGEPAFAQVVEPVLGSLGVTSPEVVHGVSLTVAFTVISFLHIVVGELAPKSIAIRHPVRMSLWTATPLFLFYWLMYPFIRVLNGSALLMLRWMGVELAHEGDEAHTANELKKVLLASHRHGELGRQETDILTRTLEFPDLEVGDLMMPHNLMVVLDADAPAADVRALMNEHSFSRYAVCQGDRGNLIGLLHVKDWCAVLNAGQEPVLRDLVRELPRVPRTMAAMKLFRRFRRGLPHFAVVTDEVDHVIGFITFDLILEAIVGGIQDEFHRRGRTWRELDARTFEGHGWYSIHSLEHLLGRHLNADQAGTVTGLVMEQLDRVPTRGDRAIFEGFSVEVVSMKGPAVDKVRVRLAADSGKADRPARGRR